MKFFLSLFDAEFGRNPRPTKIALYLRHYGHVTVCSKLPKVIEYPDIEYIALETPAIQRSIMQKFWRRAKFLLGQYGHVCMNENMQKMFIKLKDKKFDVIFCHDIHLLPLATHLSESNSCKLIMDLREYYPRQMEDNLEWRLLWKKYYTFICHEYLPQVDIAFTVSPGLAKEYKREFGVDCILLPSYAPYCDIEPHVTPHPIRCIHHGGANKGRKLEVMIEAMRLLGGTYTLDLMLMPNDVPYINFLKGKAKDIPWVRFCEPVSMLDIVKSIAEYDVGLYPLTPVNFNHLHAWPNKLFEFIQARLAVVVSPVPDMAALVREYGVGVVTDGYSAAEVAETLRMLTVDQVDGYKQASHETAQNLCWEKNDECLHAVLEQLNFV